jgi:hypothetical protein
MSAEEARLVEIQVQDWRRDHPLRKGDCISSNSPPDLLYRNVDGRSFAAIGLLESARFAKTTVVLKQSTAEARRSR